MKTNFEGHTPGPWKLAGKWIIGQHPDNSRYIAGIEQFHNENVADQYKDIEAQLKAESEANGRLIAAAPTLLECLVRTVYAGTQKELDIWIEKAKEVLKKVKE